MLVGENRRPSIALKSTITLKNFFHNKPNAVILYPCVLRRCIIWRQLLTVLTKCSLVFESTRRRHFVVYNRRDTTHEIVIIFTKTRLGIHLLRVVLMSSESVLKPHDSNCQRRRRISAMASTNEFVFGHNNISRARFRKYGIPSADVEPLRFTTVSSRTYWQYVHVRASLSSRVIAFSLLRCRT